MNYLIFDQKTNDEYTAILGTSGEIADDPENMSTTEIKLAEHLFRGVTYPAIEWTGGLAWVKMDDLRHGMIAVSKETKAKHRAPEEVDLVNTV